MSNEANAMATQVGGQHYKDMKIQHVEFVHANGIPYIEACAIKYICRHKKKNGREDIEKAIHYLQILLEREYPKPKLDGLGISGVEDEMVSLADAEDNAYAGTLYLSCPEKAREYAKLCADTRLPSLKDWQEHAAEWDSVKKPHVRIKPKRARRQELLFDPGVPLYPKALREAIEGKKRRVF